MKLENKGRLWVVGLEYSLEHLPALILARSCCLRNRSIFVLSNKTNATCGGENQLSRAWSADRITPFRRRQEEVFIVCIIISSDFAEIYFLISSLLI